MADSEQRMRAELRELRRGEYAFEDGIDNDGVDPDVQYRSHCVISDCDRCGKMVARRYLRQRHAGRAMRFCDAQCAALWREYWLPRYGARLAGSAVSPQQD